MKNLFDISDNVCRRSFLRSKYFCNFMPCYYLDHITTNMINEVVNFQPQSFICSPLKICYVYFIKDITTQILIGKNFE